MDFLVDFDDPFNQFFIYFHFLCASIWPYCVLHIKTGTYSLVFTKENAKAHTDMQS